MKKILVSLAAVLLICGAIFTLSSFTSKTETEIGRDSIMVIDAEEDEFIDVVEAQNANGTETRTFKVYGRKMANGRYWFFVKTSTREFGIQYADRNRYKPFYIKIGDERWYFASKTLELRSFETKQW